MASGVPNSVKEDIVRIGVHVDVLEELYGGQSDSPNAVPLKPEKAVITPDDRPEKEAKRALFLNPKKG